MRSLTETVWLEWWANLYKISVTGEEGRHSVGIEVGEHDWCRRTGMQGCNAKKAACRAAVSAVRFDWWLCYLYWSPAVSAAAGSQARQAVCWTKAVASTYDPRLQPTVINQRILVLLIRLTVMYRPSCCSCTIIFNRRRCDCVVCAVCRKRTTFSERRSRTDTASSAAVMRSWLSWPAYPTPRRLRPFWPGHASRSGLVRLVYLRGDRYVTSQQHGKHLSMQAASSARRDR